MAFVKKDSVGEGMAAYQRLGWSQIEPKAIFVLLGNLLTISGITGQSC